MFSEEIITRIAVGVAGSSVVGTGAITQDFGVELSIVLWLVGGLLGIIALLLAAISYFIRDMRNQNAVQHKEITHSYHDIETRLIKLEAEHGLAFQAKGCAYEPTRLKDMIREVLHEDTLLRERDESGDSTEDCGCDQAIDR